MQFAAGCVALLARKTPPQRSIPGTPLYSEVCWPDFSVTGVKHFMASRQACFCLFFRLSRAAMAKNNTDGPAGWEQPVLAH